MQYHHTWRLLVTKNTWRWNIYAGERNGEYETKYKEMEYLEVTSITIICLVKDSTPFYYYYFLSSYGMDAPRIPY